MRCGRGRLIAAGGLLLFCGCSLLGRGESAGPAVPPMIGAWMGGGETGKPRRSTKIRFASEVSNRREKHLAAKARQEAMARAPAQAPHIAAAPAPQFPPNYAAPPGPQTPPMPGWGPYPPHAQAGPMGPIAYQHPAPQGPTVPGMYPPPNGQAPIMPPAGAHGQWPQ